MPCEMLTSPPDNSKERPSVEGGNPSLPRLLRGVVIGELRRRDSRHAFELRIGVQGCQGGGGAGDRSCVATPQRFVR